MAVMDTEPRILVVRPDRIGDVILSTPVFAAIKKNFPQSYVAAVVRSEVAPLIRGLEVIDEVIVYDRQGMHAGLKGLWKFVHELRSREFRISIVLQTHWKVALAIWLAKIRFRVGPLGKVHSYLFYNHGIRQRRSQVEMHEADYNLQLLSPLGIQNTTHTFSTQVRVSELAKRKAKDWLTAQGWDEHLRWIAVHPGMGGSALNWPEGHYVDLIRALIKDGRKVVITGGLPDAPLLERLKEKLSEFAGDSLKFYQGSLGDTIEDLGGVYSFASLVVAPSTGPLHLAVALGKPVVSFFPPIRVQSAIRWGPYLSDERKASVLMPEVYCGEDFRCRGNLCHYYPCMKTITVAQAVDEIRNQMSEGK